MKFLAYFSLGIFLLNLGRLVAMDNAKDQAPSQQDRSKYETANYDLRLSKSDQWLQMKSQARAFIWDHWHRQKLARVVVTMYTKEGDATITTFWIEPDPAGIWHMRLEEESRTTAFLPKPRSEKREFHVYKVERVISKGASSGQRLNDSVQADADSYRLAMKDKSGESVGAW
jgi:hypothetical protein